SLSRARTSASRCIDRSRRSRPCSPERRERIPRKHRLPPFRIWPPVSRSPPLSMMNASTLVRTTRGNTWIGIVCDREGFEYCSGESRERWERRRRNGEPHRSGISSLGHLS
ncbi:MAG: hypothetical protein ACK56I_15760, partial [bacterium]